MASKALKLSPILKEVRIHLCPRSSQSAGVREFIQKHYVSIKKNNPGFPILIRECSGVQPKLYGRYEFGKETCVPLDNYGSDKVLEAMSTLVR